MGGDMRCSSEMGGTPDDHQKWGGCTQVPPKMRGDPCAAEGRPKKGTPPQGVFCTFPK